MGMHSAVARAWLRGLYAGRQPAARLYLCSGIGSPDSPSCYVAFPGFRRSYSCGQHLGVSTIRLIVAHALASSVRITWLDDGLSGCLIVLAPRKPSCRIGESCLIATLMLSGEARDGINAGMTDVRARSRARGDAFFSFAVVTRVTLNSLEIGELGLVGVHVACLSGSRPHVYATTINAVAPRSLRIAGARAHYRRHRLSGPIAITDSRCGAGRLGSWVGSVGALGGGLVFCPHTTSCHVPGSGTITLLIARFYPGFADFPRIAYGPVAPAFLGVRGRSEQNDENGED